MIKKTIAWISLAAIVIIMLYMLTGCKTYVYNHQKTKAEKFYKKYPGDLARICAGSFTVPTQLFIGRDSIITDTVYSGFENPVIVGDTSDFQSLWRTAITDSPGMTLSVGNGSFSSLLGTTSTRLITTTHHRVDTLKIENVAKYDSLRNYLKTKADSISSLKKQLSDKTAESKKYYGDAVARLWIIIGICVIAAVLIFLKFYL